MKPWEKYRAAGEVGPWSKYAKPKRQTIQERTADTLGLENLEERGSILPLGRTREGEVVAATPQFLVDMVQSAMLPGHVAQGGGFTAEDALKFTLDFAAPATASRGVGAGTRARQPSRQTLQEAPTTEDLKKQATQMKDLAKGSQVTPTAESYLNMASEMEDLAIRNKINPQLHPKASAVLQTVVNQVGGDLDVEDLMTTRRIINIAQRSTAPELADERRIAGLMEDLLDDWVDNLSPDDLATGDPSQLGANLRKFRNLWQRAKKSETIEEIIERAGTQASGFENGIRIGFRQLLRNKKRIRGFNKEEREIMEQIVEGTTGQKLLRLLGKLSFGTRGGSNFLGGSIGVAGGGVLGGPVGSVLAPAVGYGAQKAADANIGRQAALARALAAAGGGTTTPTSRSQALAEALVRAGGPVAGTQIEERPPLRGRPPPGVI